MKIDRANKHIADLEAAILSLEDTYTARVEKNNDTGYQELIHAFPNFEDTALDLSLIIGDAIHNLHTALDFAWVSTIEKHFPSIKSKSTKFPVRPTREDLEGTLHGVKIDTLCPALFELIVSDIQPYEGGKNGVIHALHDLDIFDKHLLLLELTPYAHIRGIVMQEKDGQIFHGNAMPVQNSGPYVIPFESDVHIKDKGQLAVAVTIKEAGRFKGVPVLDLLTKFSKYVFYVVQLLENL